MGTDDQNSKLPNLPGANWPNLPGDKLISDKDRGDTGAISDAINSMYLHLASLLNENKDSLNGYIKESETKFTQLNSKVDALGTKFEGFQSSLNSQATDIESLKTGKATLWELEHVKEHIKEIESRFTSLYEDLERKNHEKDLVIEAQQRELRNSRLEVKRLVRDHNLLKERVNAHDIRAKKLFFTIDGLPEEKDHLTIKVIVDRLSKDTDTTISQEDFSWAHRVGKPKQERVRKGKRKISQSPPKVKPRHIRLKVSNDDSRELLLACRGKLSQNLDKSNVWINEEHPAEYRRRKTMLRDLVKFINKSGNQKASIEAGGLKIGSEYFRPDQFNDLPSDYHPRNVQIIRTEKNELLFAGEWAYLSNMFPCIFEYEETEFTSSEQCFQYQKALYHNEFASAFEINTTNDPFTCKKIGELIPDENEWIKCREQIMYDINKAKFAQNDDILELFLNTGNYPLLEATLGDTWGINASLRSQTARESNGSGHNLFGKLLVKLRSDLRETHSNDLPPLENSCSDRNSESGESSLTALI